MNAPSLGPCGHLRGAAGTVAVAGCVVVVVRGKAVMGQCLAMGGCQTLRLLIINVIFINKHIINKLLTPDSGATPFR
jgi:hypothetical protein